MGNDWSVALTKLVKNAVVGVAAIGTAFFIQLDAQCPGAILAIGGGVVSIKVILDFLANIAKHRND